MADRMRLVVKERNLLLMKQRADFGHFKIKV